MLLFIYMIYVALIITASPFHVRLPPYNCRYFLIYTIHIANANITLFAPLPHILPRTEGSHTGSRSLLLFSAPAAGILTVSGYFPFESGVPYTSRLPA